MSNETSDAAVNTTSTSPVKAQVQENVQPSATSEIPNPKFKTALCKNFINSICNRQTGCHFAHGSGELRAVSENSGFFEEVEKPNTDYLNRWPTNIPTNYKTTLCKFYEQVGTCKYDQNCNFAHGDQEKRQIPENVQSQLKNARNTSKHINNSAGHKNSQQKIMSQLMNNSAYVQQYMMQVLLSQQFVIILGFCQRIAKSASNDEYVKKTVSDIEKLAEESKLKQALSQLQKLCMRKEASEEQKEILKEIESYLQNNSAPANQGAQSAVVAKAN